MQPSQCSNCGAKAPAAAGESICKYCGTALQEDFSKLAVALGRTQATRSNDTRLAVPITFLNRRAAVTLHWLDFEGNAQPYGRVEPQARAPFNTYVGHIWSIRDAESGRELLRWAATDQVPRQIEIE